MHALDERTLQNFMPNLKPLDAEAKAILDKNREYFHRCAAHILAEQLKGSEKIKKQYWAKHIVYSYEQFQKTMMCLKKPDSGEDPVETYGWKRDEPQDMKTLDKLQDQHKEVAMQCYQYGYKRACPEWMRFLKTPVYWFKVYSALLLSQEYKSRWLTQLVDRPEGLRISATEEVLMWGNKLSLLKANAPESERKDLNVDAVTESLLGEAQIKIGYVQAVNEEALKLLDEVGYRPSSRL